MPPHPALGEADLKTMLEWILAGAGSHAPHK